MRERDALISQHSDSMSKISGQVVRLEKALEAAEKRAREEHDRAEEWKIKSSDLKRLLQAADAAATESKKLSQNAQRALRMK